MTIVTLTSKNQVTIPAELARAKMLAKGTKLTARWQGNDLVLSPQEDFETVLRDVQARLRSLIRKPQTDEKLRRNLRDIPKSMQ
jgi:bifunctional DNA-binding transcriptional regulator/antitoxin component of YhaV-PrlF toxin-antitoxin module